MHGIDPAAGFVPNPEVGTDPTQGRGSDAWQQALRLGNEINARNRRN